MLLLLVSLCLSTYLRSCAGDSCTEEHAAKERKCADDIWRKLFRTRAEKEGVENGTPIGYGSRIGTIKFEDFRCLMWEKFDKCLPDCQPLAHQYANEAHQLACQPEFREAGDCLAEYPEIGKKCYSQVKGKGKNVTINGFDTVEYERAEICPVQKCLAEEGQSKCGEKAYKLYETYDRQKCFSEPI